MGYGYDPEETTGQEHMDGTAPESGGHLISFFSGSIVEPV